MTRGTVRIIGGQWRGRKLKVPNIPHLRPTPDRVRETVFNWLAPYIVGAHCLDLFAGSGALGFEALSRGAASVVMVDQSAAVVHTLEEACVQLKTERASVLCIDAPEGLYQPMHPFDIIFLDPPYQSSLLLHSCFFLNKNPGFLSQPARFYLESDHEILENELPLGFRVVKSDCAGQVYYYLVKTHENL